MSGKQVFPLKIGKIRKRNMRIEDLLKLAYRYAHDKKNKKAIKTYLIALDVNFLFAINLYYVWHVLIKSGKFKAKFWCNLGVKAEAVGFYDFAIQAHMKAIERDPLFHKSWESLGSLYEFKNNYDKAAECYEKALEIDSNCIFVLRHLGNVYFISQKYHLALKTFYRLIKIYNHTTAINDSQKILTLYYLCVSYRNIGEFNKAINACMKVLEINPKSTLAWNHIAIIHERAGKFYEALKAYKNGLEIDPDNILLIRGFKKLLIKLVLLILFYTKCLICSY
jgi:tetratricopeptide (TPR) repeat protein